MKAIDLTGQRFGKFTVIERTENGNRGQVRYMCRCECGTIVIKDAGDIVKNIRNGVQSSCGCFDSKRKPNDYSFNGSVGYCHLSNGDVVTFDTEDYDKIKEYRWSKSGKTHVQCSKWNGTKYVTLYIHRLIMDCPDGMVVDHINGDKLDNRKCNLRVCTQQENSWNARISSRNKYGYKGVYFDARNNSYTARVNIGKKTHHIGSFKTLTDAINARLTWEMEHWGEFRLKE